MRLKECRLKTGCGLFLQAKYQGVVRREGGKEGGTGGRLQDTLLQDTTTT